MTQTTPQDLAAQIEALAANAKPGDWKNYRCFGTAQGAPNEICVSGNYASGAVGSAIRAEDAELICLLKNNLPAIVAALGEGEGEPKWAGDITVGDMIANLRTMPADMPLHSAYYVRMGDGRMRTFVRHPTVSRERVDGREIKTGDESVPYSAVVWTQPQDAPAPDERDDEVRRLREALIDASNALEPLVSAVIMDGPGGRFSKARDARMKALAVLSPAKGGEA